MGKNKIQDEFKDSKVLYEFLEECIVDKVNKNLSKKKDKFLEAYKLFLGKDASSTVDNCVHWLNDKGLDNTWIGITGSWRTINKEVVDDINKIVRYAISEGMGILTGGALGVDYIATDLVLFAGNPFKELRIVLPINRLTYIERIANSYDKIDGIDKTQVDLLTNQLEYINSKYPEIIFDDSHFNEKDFLKPENENYRTDSYYFRNGLIAYGCNGLVALCINNSKGVIDTINKAKFMKKPIFIKNYEIDENSKEVIKDYSQIDIPNLDDSRLRGVLY